MAGAGVRRSHGVRGSSDITIDDRLDDVAIDLRSVGAQPSAQLAPDPGRGVASVAVPPMRFALHRLLVSPHRDVPMVDARVAGAVKRATDLFASLLLLVVFSPVLVVCGGCGGGNVEGSGYLSTGSGGSPRSHLPYDEVPFDGGRRRPEGRADGRAGS